jgi:hypothetical protein
LCSQLLAVAPGSGCIREEPEFETRIEGECDLFFCSLA